MWKIEDGGQKQEVNIWGYYASHPKLALIFHSHSHPRHTHCLPFASGCWMWWRPGSRVHVLLFLSPSLSGRSHIVACNNAFSSLRHGGLCSAHLAIRHETHIEWVGKWKRWKIFTYVAFNSIRESPPVSLTTRYMLSYMHTCQIKAELFEFAKVWKSRQTCPHTAIFETYICPMTLECRSFWNLFHIKSMSQYIASNGEWNAKWKKDIFIFWTWYEGLVLFHKEYRLQSKCNSLKAIYFSLFAIPDFIEPASQGSNNNKIVASCKQTFTW